MKEYSGKSSHKYIQAKDKRYLLTPAIIRHIPKCKGEMGFLDVGCGDGFFYDIATKKGYKYYGIDISKDMVNRSKHSYPNGNFAIGSATSFTKKIKQKFDIILINMVSPCLNNKKDFDRIFAEAKKALTDSGQIIIGSTHSCFDGYMKVGVLKRGLGIIKTNFKGYFESGQKYLVNRNFNGKKFVFEDHHWMFSDYINSIAANGMKLVFMDECKPAHLFDGKDKNFIKESYQFPIFFVLGIKK